MTKLRYIILAIAESYATEIQGREEEVKKRAEACGLCAFTQALKSINCNGLEIVLYKCTGRPCRKTLDYKIASPNQTCPKRMW